jgi:hypothetical protein
MPARVSRIFFQKYPGSFGNQHGKFGNRAIIDIQTARTALLGCCKKLNCLSDQLGRMAGIKLSLEARANVHDRLYLTLSVSAIGLAFRK